MAERVRTKQILEEMTVPTRFPYRLGAMSPEQFNALLMGLSKNDPSGRYALFAGENQMSVGGKPLVFSIAHISGTKMEVGLTLQIHYGDSEEIWPHRTFWRHFRAFRKEAKIKPLTLVKVEGD